MFMCFGIGAILWRWYCVCTFLCKDYVRRIFILLFATANVIETLNHVFRILDAFYQEILPVRFGF